MKRGYFNIMYLAIPVALLLTVDKLHSQAYIDFSKYEGGSGGDIVSKMQVINGETYIVGTTTSSNFPVTNGSTYGGGLDLTVTKFSSNGTVIYSTYIGGLGHEKFTSMQVLNGEVYLLAYTDSINYPVTNGSVFMGKLDVVVTKFTSTGNIAFSTYLGDTGNDYPVTEIVTDGNDVYVAGTTESPGFPVTNGSIYNGGASDGFITKLNINTGAIILSKFLGGSNREFARFLAVENGFIYFTGSTYSLDIPVTIGGPIIDAAENCFIIKLNSTNFNIDYARYLGGVGTEIINRPIVLNGIFHLCGYTYSSNYPVTNGTTVSGQINDPINGFYTRLNTNGSIGFSTYLTTEDQDLISDMLISNGEVYLSGNSLAATGSQLSAVYLLIHKLNPNGSFAYSKKFPIGLNNPIPTSFQVFGGDLYYSGVTRSPGYPVTDGSQFYNGGTAFFTHLNSSGDIVFSAFLGKMNSLLPLRVSNSKFYLLGVTDIASYPVTDLSVISGGTDNILVALEPNGTKVFAGYIGGSGSDLAAGLEADNNQVYFCGRTTSANYPVTNNILYKGNTDIFLTRLSFCPTSYDLTNDTLSPQTQTVCKFGLAELIEGGEITVPGDSLPGIYLNGIQSQQTPIKATYQWQVAISPTGPWNNIPSAILKDYRPVIGAISQYYRRLSFTLHECGTTLIHTSDTASVLANTLTAPTVDAGGPFNTCPSSAINIGGSPTVTGGNPPYASYIWDMGAAGVPNPLVSPNASSIYTLIVTDALGCRQIGQAVVLTYRADAGPDKSACGGIAVKIGGPPIAGVPGILYDWQPGTDLSSTNIAQPFANPGIPRDYSLTLTVPKTGGGDCVTKDTVRVTPVAPPVTANIAGPDKVFCLKDSVSLGTPAEAGFNYTWSPGSYLTRNTFSTTGYYAGNIIMPVPNPAIINLTAHKDGCSFPDQTIVSTIEARAGLDGCGPRIIGMPDRTPDINETYAWTKISGSGDFTGATNLPQVHVSASVGTPTIYGLTVTYNDGSCYDEITVPPFCSNCQVFIDIEALYTCPSYSVNGGNVTLIGSSSIANAIYTWTPQVGLSNYTGNVVHLTDNVPRIYTVIATDVNDTSIHCIGQQLVNDPVFSKPVFPAPDTVACVNEPITIGLPPVAGYTYQWTGSGLSSNLISNPTASVAVQTEFPVLVSDGNGCELHDTVVVAVQNLQVDAGPDWVICSNGVVQLGTPAQPNTSYLWEPQSAPWQNGTNQFSAEPDVFIATDLSFIVTATTSAGCVTTDTVNTSINLNPSIPDASDKFVCKGDSVRIGSPALGGVTYQWSPTTGLDNAGIAQPLASPAVNTTYTVIASFPGSCAFVASDEVTVTVRNAFFSMPDINFCPANGPVALGNAAPANMLSYSWQPQQLVTNSTIANPNTLNPPPNTTTFFTLLVTNADGCRYRDTISLIPLSTVPVAGPDKIICKNQTTTIGSTTNVTGPTISYSWSPVDNLSDPSIPNPVFTGVTGGVFIYILTKTVNTVSCILSDTVIVRVVDSLLPPMNTPTACQNSCVQIGTTPVAGVQYQWTPITGLSNANIANPLACVGAVTASYTLLATDVNGCRSSANVVVGVHALPAAQITIPVVTACVGDTNAMFNPLISPAGVYTYLWSPDNGTLSDINSLTPGITITDTGSTQYVLQVTDMVTGCTNTAIGNLVVNICPPVSIVGDFMWFDLNSDGIQDSGEPGVSGINVRLYNSADFNVASTATDANGFYSFTNILPGNDYYVIFNKPAGYDFTAQNVGGIGADNNSKADLDGRSNDFNIPSGASILNIDAGITATCPVPVTLLSFTAVLRNREVLLNWQTTAEYNNDHFDIERSNGGNYFSSIGIVDGNGTTALPHNYSLIDEHPLTGMNYYRLRQVDLDGHSSFSEIVPVQLDNPEIVSAYYDNQCNCIRVVFNKEQDQTQLKLYGANGQLIKGVSAKNNIATYTFELPVLATGIYVLQIMNEQFTYSKKLFINK